MCSDGCCRFSGTSLLAVAKRLLSHLPVSTLYICVGRRRESGLKEEKTRRQLGGRSCALFRSGVVALGSIHTGTSLLCLPSFLCIKRKYELNEVRSQKTMLLHFYKAMLGHSVAHAMLLHFNKRSRIGTLVTLKLSLSKVREVEQRKRTSSKGGAYSRISLVAR